MKMRPVSFSLSPLGSTARAPVVILHTLVSIIFSVSPRDLTDSLHAAETRETARASADVRGRASGGTEARVYVVGGPVASDSR